MTQLQHSRTSFLLPILLAVVVLVSCGKFQQPEFRGVRDVNVRSLAKEGSLRFQLVCYNPNNYGATVKNTRCSLVVNQIYLGEFTQDSTVRIQKRSDFGLPVTLKLKHGQNLVSLMPVLMADSTVIEVTGQTRVGKSGVFSSYPINYTGVQKLDLFR